MNTALRPDSEVRSLPARIADLFALVRFSHTLFALPWAGIGLLLALPASLGLHQLAGAACCLVSARTAAMAFNRWCDRGIDARNPRTAQRPSVTGRVSSGAMLVLVVVGVAVFWCSAWWINPLCGMLAPVALVVVLGYSLTKRFTALCHVVLGIGLGLAPVGAYLAVRGSFDAVAMAAVSAGLAVTFWTAGFDILYALADMECDRREGLHSLPARLGVRGAMNWARWLHAAMLLALAAAGWLAGLSLAWWIGVGITALLLILEHRMLSPKDLSRLNTAFFTVNVSLGFVMLAAAGVDTWIRLS